MEKKAKILIVDDEAIICESLRDWLSDVGHQVLIAENGPKALETMQQESPDIVFTDLVMPGMDGIELLKRVKEVCPSTEVVIITAYGSIPTAIAAMREGAYDYIEKPFSPDKAELLIEKVTERQLLIEENIFLRQKLAERRRPESMIAKSAKMQEVVDLIKVAAETNAPVLITGESGTGKEFVAQTIHSRSHREDKPFVAVSCAAFPGSALESELFGQEKSAFSGARAKRRGKFEIANGGTLLLDEIGQMSPSVQAHLLRVLEEKEFATVGGNEPIRVDVRIISVADKDIKQALASGRFRQDLYYRLSMVTIELPPLRERKEDIRPLAQFFLKKFAAQNRKDVTGFSPEAMRFLMKYDWPGNVRELENIVGRAVILAKNSYVQFTDLRQWELTLAVLPEGVQMLKEVEKNHILDVLTRTGGNYSQAARILGISRGTLHNKVKAYGLPLKDRA